MTSKLDDIIINTNDNTNIDNNDQLINIDNDVMSEQDSYILPIVNKCNKNNEEDFYAFITNTSTENKDNPARQAALNAFKHTLLLWKNSFIPDDLSFNYAITLAKIVYITSSRGMNEPIIQNNLDSFISDVIQSNNDHFVDDDEINKENQTKTPNINKMLADVVKLESIISNIVNMAPNISQQNNQPMIIEHLNMNPIITKLVKIESTLTELINTKTINNDSNNMEQILNRLVNFELLMNDLKNSTPQSSQQIESILSQFSTFETSFNKLIKQEPIDIEPILTELSRMESIVSKVARQDSVNSESILTQLSKIETVVTKLSKQEPVDIENILAELSKIESSVTKLSKQEQVNIEPIITTLTKLEILITKQSKQDVVNIDAISNELNNISTIINKISKQEQVNIEPILSELTKMESMITKPSKLQSLLQDNFNMESVYTSLNKLENLVTRNIKEQVSVEPLLLDITQIKSQLQRLDTLSNTNNVSTQTVLINLSKIEELITKSSSNMDIQNEIINLKNSISTLPDKLDINNIIKKIDDIDVLITSNQISSIIPMLSDISSYVTNIPSNQLLLSNIQTKVNSFEKTISLLIATENDSIKKIFNDELCNIKLINNNNSSILNEIINNTTDIKKMISNMPISEKTKFMINEISDIKTNLILNSIKNLSVDLSIAFNDKIILLEKKIMESLANNDKLITSTINKLTTLEPILTNSIKQNGPSDLNQYINSIKKIETLLSTKPENVDIIINKIDNLASFIGNINSSNPSVNVLHNINNKLSNTSHEDVLLLLTNLEKKLFSSNITNISTIISNIDNNVASLPSKYDTISSELIKLNKIISDMSSSFTNTTIREIKKLQYIISEFVNNHNISIDLLLSKLTSVESMITESVKTATTDIINNGIQAFREVFNNDIKVINTEFIDKIQSVASNLYNQSYNNNSSVILELLTKMSNIETKLDNVDANIKKTINISKKQIHSFINKRHNIKSKIRRYDLKKNAQLIDSMTKITKTIDKNTCCRNHTVRIRRYDLKKNIQSTNPLSQIINTQHVNPTNYRQEQLLIYNILQKHRSRKT